MTNQWSENGGHGSIVQRFGLAADGALSPVSHTFGLRNPDAQAAWTAVHNVRYDHGPNGRERLSIFENGIAGSNSSWLYEFDLRLAPQELLNGSTPSDAVFDTTYQSAPCPFYAIAEGGVRAIGHSSSAGVWLVSSGAAGVGLACVDDTGSSSLWASPTAAYDPFTYVVVDAPA